MFNDEKRKFDPAGSTGDEFFHLFWQDIEDSIDDDLFDEDVVWIDANPHPRLRKALVVKHPASRRVPSVPTPNYRIDDLQSGVAVSVWFVPAVDEILVGSNGKPSQWHLFLMVRKALASAHGGAVSDRMLNPFHVGLGAFSAPVVMLSDLKANLVAAGFWGGAHTMVPQFASAGGKSDSPATKTAKRANSAKARAAKARKRQERDLLIREANDMGTDDYALAAQFEVSEQVIRGALSRTAEA